MALNFGEPEKEQPVTLACMLAAQKKNQRCRDLPDKMEQNEHSRFSETAEGLLVRVAPMDGAVQVYVPSILRQDLLRLERNVVRAGYPRINRMYDSVRRRYFWKSMAADVYDTVASSASCYRNKIAQRRRTAKLKLFPAMDPFLSLAMDLVGPLAETKAGKGFLRIIVDRISELVRAVPPDGVNATDVSSAICRDWTSVYEPPETVLTDNGPQFASLFFQGVFNVMGIRNLYTSTYYPHTNGQVKHFKKSLVDMFMLYIKDHKDTWDELIAVLALAYNSRPTQTTGVAPMDLVTPRRLRNLSLQRMPDSMTPDPSQSEAEAKDAFLKSLKALLV